jgi:hypothetical protein
MRFISQKYGRGGRVQRAERAQEVQWVQEVQRFNVFKCSRSSKFERTGYFRVLDGFLRINVSQLPEGRDFYYKT